MLNCQLKHSTRGRPCPAVSFNVFANYRDAHLHLPTRRALVDPLTVGPDAWCTGARHVIPHLPTRRALVDPLTVVP